MEDLRLKVGYLKRRLKEGLKGWLEGRLKGGLTSSKPLPPSLPSNFFSLYIAPSPEASGKSLYMWPGLASLAPTTYTKTCPAYATPFVPTLLKTASPERLLRPPLASSPASNFFSLYNAPLSGGLRQLFVYVAEAPPPASHFFSLYNAPPSQEASGNSLYMWPRPP